MFEVSVSPDLQQQLVSVVQELGVSVPHPVSAWLHAPTLVSFFLEVLILMGPRFQPADPSTSVSLVQGKMATFEASQRQSGAGVVPWSPPQVNWNPWTSCNIDEGPLAFVSLRGLPPRPSSTRS